MVKKEFYIPFKWEDRRPIVIEKLLYIPKFYDKHSLFKEKKYFKNTNEINIEFCSGNGKWIIEMAKQNPDINYIAVEIKFDRAKKIWKKMHIESLKNLFVVLGDAFSFAKYYLEDDAISNIYINFPDPWPKRKHAKHRLVRKEFICEVKRVMKKDKIITLVTDDANYLNQMINVFLRCKSFESIYKKPYYVQNLENFGDSFFKTLFKQKKKNINYLKFKKK
jgi:tRNA (guanine-N7-)-methyltransferase